MKQIMAVVGLLVFVLRPGILHAQYPGDCTTYNGGWSSNQSMGDTQEHLTGDHQDTDNFSGTCTYAGAPKSGACSIECSETTTGIMSDSEDLTNPFYTHVINDSKQTEQRDQMVPLSHAVEPSHLPLPPA